MSNYYSLCEEYWNQNFASLVPPENDHYKFYIEFKERGVDSWYFRGRNPLQVNSATVYIRIKERGLKRGLPWKKLDEINRGNFKLSALTESKLMEKIEDMQEKYAYWLETYQKAETAANERYQVARAFRDEHFPEVDLLKPWKSPGEFEIRGICYFEVREGKVTQFTLKRKLTEEEFLGLIP